MYQIGQRVVYGSHGVCLIVDVENKIVDKKAVEYYVLAPMLQPETRYYIPVHNEIAVSRIRELLTADQWRELLSEDRVRSCVWITDENRRKIQYRELINRARPEELIPMVQRLRIHRDEQLRDGKKFHVSDAGFLKDATNLAAQEISVVLDIPVAEAQQKLDA